MAEPLNKAWSFVAILFITLQLLLDVKGITVTRNGTMILEDNTEISIQFDPPEITALQTKHERRVYFNITVLSSREAGHEIGKRENVADDVMIHVECDQPDNAIISGRRDFALVDVMARNTDLNLTDQQSDPLYFTVRGVFLGYSHVQFYINGSTFMNSSFGTLDLLSSENSRRSTVVDVNGVEYGSLLPIDYTVVVIREKRLIDDIFIGAVVVLVFFSNMGMGCKVDLNVVKEIFKKPIAPTIGFCSQYLIMPLAAFASLTIMGLEGGLAFGLFAAGCAPGGAGSNMYTYLLDGDVSLSVTMTFISTLASLFMIPAWFYTLGRLITERGATIHVPFMNIFVSLFSLMVPVVIGIVIRRKRPDVAQVLGRALRPFFIVLIIFMFTFGVWVNLYIFRLMTVTLCAAGAMLPYLGFVLGGLAAFVCRQPWSRVVTIAIETGLQNTGIPILLLKLSLPQPSADMSVVSPVAASIFTPIPLFTAVIVYEIWRHCRKKVAKLDEPSDVVTNMVNGDAIAEARYTDEDLKTPDDPKVRNSPKLRFNFDETNNAKK